VNWYGDIMKDDPRYPYTHCADFIRMEAGYDRSGTKLSRSDASGLKTAIAAALGMDDHEFACKMADFFLANQEKLVDKATREFIREGGMNYNEI
jgi:hypothetical protein